MFGTGRRAVELVVGLFALLGFVYVPLGHKTGFEHLRAIAATPAARQAASDLVDAALWARTRVLAGLTGGSEGHDRDPESAPAPDPEVEPRPRVPRLGPR